MMFSKLCKNAIFPINSSNRTSQQEYSVSRSSTTLVARRNRSHSVPREYLGPSSVRQIVQADLVRREPPPPYWVHQYHRRPAPQVADSSTSDSDNENQRSYTTLEKNAFCPDLLYSCPPKPTVNQSSSTEPEQDYEEIDEFYNGGVSRLSIKTVNQQQYELSKEISERQLRPPDLPARCIANTEPKVMGQNLSQRRPRISLTWVLREQPNSSATSSIDKETTTTDKNKLRSNGKVKNKVCGERLFSEKYVNGTNSQNDFEKSPPYVPPDTVKDLLFVCSKTSTSVEPESCGYVSDCDRASDPYTIDRSKKIDRLKRGTKFPVLKNNLNNLNCAKSDNINNNNNNTNQNHHHHHQQQQQPQQKLNRISGECEKLNNYKDVSKFDNSNNDVKSNFGIKGTYSEPSLCMTDGQGRRHRRRRRDRNRSQRFGYEIKNVDDFLSKCSLSSPGNIPVVLSSSSTLYQTRPGGYQIEIPLPLGMVVNAIFKNQNWLYVQTPHAEEGYVGYAACLPLGILPQTRSASTSKPTPCWENSGDVFPKPCGNMTDSEKEIQLRGGTRSEGARTPRLRRNKQPCGERNVDVLYLRAASQPKFTEKSYTQLRPCSQKIYRPTPIPDGSLSSQIKSSTDEYVLLHHRKSPAHFQQNIPKVPIQNSIRSLRQTLLAITENFVSGSISVNKGDVVTLLACKQLTPGKQWFYVRARNGGEGFIPAEVAGHGFL